MTDRRPLLLLAAGLTLVMALYLPGLSGPWLLDDFNNLGPFLEHAPGAAPYRDIIFSNPSGPLGRSVSMASFAANHALGLFDTPALKTTNLALHLVNGLLAFLLLRALFARRAPGTRIDPGLLAALLAVAWTLLPLHISAVLYVVQRMTVLAATFSLLTLLACVHGRGLLATRPRQGLLFLGLGLGLAFPLALFSKESAATTLAALLLVELFFFRPAHARPVLAVLVTATALGLLAIALYPPALITNSYAGRAFTLDERLLTQPRVIVDYARALLLPGPADLGLFHDDIVHSRSLTTPATTLPALLLLLAAATASVLLAASPRLWGLAFGLAFFLTGHLVESTAIPLELYFEHRNYLPALGLLVALAALLIALPLRARLLSLLAVLWLAFLAASTAHRAYIWGDEGRLLQASVTHHPQSVRANDTWMEFLVGQGHFAEALAEGDRFAMAAPDTALSTRLHMISVWCRAGQPVPPALLQAAADSAPYSLMEINLLELNLRQLSSLRARGHCHDANFTALAAPLLAWDAALRDRYGARLPYYWPQRLAVAEFLVRSGRPDAAVPLLADILAPDLDGAQAEAGLLLVRVLRDAGDAEAAEEVLQRLEVPGLDRMPASARRLLGALREQSGGATP